jgi:phosphopantothenoylcysteine decarboxylase/phosphopantothenate--cysteine ligase
MTEQSGRLAGRRIALGITGSIAAYKAVELLRLFQTEGADVRVLMTPSATAFVGQLTLETLSRHPVDVDVLSLQDDGRIGHISAANDVEAIVVAPATAHWLGAMAHGLAGDSITAACLATSVPVVVAPAMDGGMYAHPATQANVARVRQFGYQVIEPEVGPLASGMVGRGRLAELWKIVDATVDALSGVPAAAIEADPAVELAGPAPALAEAPAAAFSPPAPDRVDFAGRHVVITAGGTAEPIDPIRFLGNRSTGKMGIAIAEDALDRGAVVTLILGHVTVTPPAGAHVARVETAAEMQAALRALTPPDGPVFDVLVMAAAVADFRPRTTSDKKLSRGGGMTLELDSTPDLLAEAAERVRTGSWASGGRRPILVGFAAETGSTDRAAEKVRAKGVDMLVANDVTEPGSGFGTDTNRVTIYYPEGAPEQLPMLSKREVAELLLDRILIRLDSRATAEEPEPEQALAADGAAEPATTPKGVS